MYSQRSISDGEYELGLGFLNVFLVVYLFYLRTGFSVDNEL
jgi:hypothetical protein